MATIYCPTCRTEFKQPTGIVGWIMSTLAVLFGGGFLVIVICVAAASLVPKANGNQQAAQVQAAQAQAAQAQSTNASGQRQVPATARPAN